MAVLKKCLFPILLLASLISLAAAARNIPLHIDDHSISIFGSPPNHDDALSPVDIKRPLPPPDVVDSPTTDIIHPHPPKFDVGDTMYSSSKWLNGWRNGWGNNGYNYGNWGNGGNGYGNSCTGTCYGGVCTGTCYNNGGWGWNRGWGWGRTQLAASDAFNTGAVPPEAAKGNSPTAISEAITSASEEIGTWPGITSP